MSARKLFVGIEAPANIATDMARRAGLDDAAINPLQPHLTLQYCGKEASDADVETIKRIWTEQLAKVGMSPLYDSGIATTGKLALYGKDEDQLVALCVASAKLHEVVKAARGCVRADLPHILASDFDFSPHITLGVAKEIPDNAVVPPTSFTFDKLFLWGDNSEVRDTIAIPFAE